MAQTGGVLLMQTLGTQGQKKLMYFTGIDGARFRKPVVPGDQLRLEVSVLQSKRQVFRMQGRATVEGALVAEAELSSIVVDRDPSKPPETPLLV
jgi:3-hydroxyacyl-[acyl-carrier-protein] dehydratase